MDKALKKLVKEKDWDRLKRLRQGLESTSDPVTWRTLIVDIRLMLGTQIPDKQVAEAKTYDQGKALVEELVKGTYIEPLAAEIVRAVYGRWSKVKLPELEVLIYNGRHLPDKLLYKLADELKAQGKSVAVVNPVGRYNDEQTRVVAPLKLLRLVGKLIILASTQRQQGGSFQVLGQVMRCLRNQELATAVGEVWVVTPMFGGSRGHRLGQDEELGYEVLESVYYPKLLALTTKDILNRVKGESQKDRLAFELSGKRVPKVKFVTVDIHDKNDPKRAFETEGFEFVSVSPAAEFAEEIVKYLEKNKLDGVPIRVVSPDKGAIPRTEEFAICLGEKLKQFQDEVELLVVSMKKTRAEAGVVGKVELGSVVKWRWTEKGVEKVEKRATEYDWHEPAVMILVDDMLDTCGTAAFNVEELKRASGKLKAILLVATHGVFSKGVEVLDKVKADLVLVSNTLEPRGLGSRPEVRMVDVAKSLVREIYKKEE